MFDIFTKIKSICLNDDDDTLRLIRKLGLLSILSGFDMEVIKEALSNLLSNMETREDKVLEIMQMSAF